MSSSIIVVDTTANKLDGEDGDDGEDELKGKSLPIDIPRGNGGNVYEHGKLTDENPCKSLESFWLGKSTISCSTTFGSAPTIEYWGAIIVRPSPIGVPASITSDGKGVGGDWLMRARAKRMVDEWMKEPGLGWDCLIMVSKRGDFYSFPRAARQPNETARQTAARELELKTGLSEDDWSLTGKIVSEYALEFDEDAPFPPTAYFVGRLATNPTSSYKKHAKWIPIPIALKSQNWPSQHKQVLLAATNLLNQKPSQTL